MTGFRDENGHNVAYSSLIGRVELPPEKKPDAPEVPPNVLEIIDEQRDTLGIGLEGIL